MKHALARESSKEDLINKDEKDIEKIEKHRIKFEGKGVLKMIKAIEI